MILQQDIIKILADIKEFVANDSAYRWNTIKDDINKSHYIGIYTMGDDGASKVYVRNKKTALAKLDIPFRHIALPNTEEDAIEILEHDMRNLSVSGMLIQLPLPEYMNKYELIHKIPSKKDVDGLNPENFGNLVFGKDTMSPCTAMAVMSIINGYVCKLKEIVPNYGNISNNLLDGKVVAVVGRSNIVGKPVVNMLINKGATVININSKTPEHVKMNLMRSADIIVSGVGISQIFDHRYVRHDQLFIDVGISRDSANKLCGDLNVEDIKHFTEHNFVYTPVPGGVGPLTVAYFINNCIKCLETSHNNRY